MHFTGNFFEKYFSINNKSTSSHSKRYDQLTKCQITCRCYKSNYQNETVWLMWVSICANQSLVHESNRYEQKWFLYEILIYEMVKEIM